MTAVIPRESGVSSTPQRCCSTLALWNTGSSAFADDDIRMWVDAVHFPVPDASPPDQFQPFVLGKHGDAVLLGLCEFRAGAGTGDHVIRLLRHRARSLGAEPLGHGLGLVARHLLQRAGEDDGLAGDRRVAFLLL